VEVVMAIDVRQATAADAAVIAALNVDVQRIHAEAHPWRFKMPGPETFTAADAERLLAQPGYFALLATRDGEPVGYLVGEAVWRQETARHHAQAPVHVHQISVRPSARRSGAGRALLAAARARGAGEGISMLVLDVWSFDTEAQAFFRANGFVPSHVRMWARE
jgi:ribosomal protein S18 acetylase RimI-like enzyme